jgi:multiple sugar transport system permease protein
MAINTASKMQPWEIRERRREILLRGAITMFALLLISVYLMPLGYGVVTSLKSAQQASDSEAPILPSEIVEYEYEGKTYDVYQVPTEDGVREWALVKKGRESSQFVDPQSPEAGRIEWEGRWRTLEPARELALQWDNYPEAWNTINYVRLLGNTFKYAFVSMIGAVVSSAFVAYGFARFRFPGKGVLFMLLMATIILPSAVTLVPTYAFFIRIGWGGTWLPLIVPQFFANAYNVFLMRQYFLTIPREMEEAASIDGANPLRTFVDVILPQALPALVAVCLFHFFFAWNDFFGPLIYLAGNSEQFPISVGLTLFNGLYASEPQLILAASLIAMVPPLTIFFLAQRVFIQGIVASGVEK